MDTGYLNKLVAAGKANRISAGPSIADPAALQQDMYLVKVPGTFAYTSSNVTPAKSYLASQVGQQNR